MCFSRSQGKSLAVPSPAPAAIIGQKRDSVPMPFSMPCKCSLRAAKARYFPADPLPHPHRLARTGWIDVTASAGVAPMQAHASATLGYRMANSAVRSDRARYVGPFRKVAHDRQDFGLVHLKQSAQLIHGCLVVVDTDIAERIFFG